MALPDEDVAARGRSIFERLRAEQEALATQPEPEVPGEPAVVQWGDLPRVDAESAADEPSVGTAASEAQSPAGGPLDNEPALAGTAEVEQAPSGSAVGGPPSEAGVAEGRPIGDRSTDGASAGTSVGGGSGAGPAAEDPATGGQAFGGASEDATAEPVVGRALQEDAVLIRSAVGGALDDVPALTEPAVDDATGGATVAEEPVEEIDRSFARPLPRVMAVANQKGGVGKTTTTVNLGASLAVLGYRTLVVDLDPQGNATTGLGINSRNLEHSIYDVILHDVPLEDCIEPTSLRNLFVAPATIDLAGAEIELVPAFSRELRLKRALEEVLDDYDFVLIDCPPSLGLLTVNGLSAATEVLVPIQCEYYALEGLGQLLRNVNLVQSNLNPKLELSAIVLTMYDARTKLAEQVAAEVRSHFGAKVCRHVIPRTVRLSEAPSFGQPIIVFDPSSRGALAYRELSKEVSGGAPQRTG
ncbi:MAG: chromosome partitioning protein [Actinomycetota bacterium]|nr:chromosome partitioning protein [Actinomycetota bacterium]